MSDNYCDQLLQTLDLHYASRAMLLLLGVPPAAFINKQPPVRAWLRGQGYGCGWG